MSAAGRVCTGFSKPYVAKYAAAGGVVTYSEGMLLARGVSVDISPDSASDDNIFYADNVAAETVGGTFTGGTVTLTVDGLLDAARRLVLGLPAAGADGFIAFGDDQNIPNVGIGFIARFMSNGVTTYVPVILAKCRFNEPAISAETQEEEIDWQTEELEAAILRDDSANHVWKYLGEEQPTEAEAEAKIKTKFNIT